MAAVRRHRAHRDKRWETYEWL
ncbi:hypothetical protein AGR1C_pAt40219 [Agrobacterium fabacearum TT111]|nr:hypothetical protein AGR1C_pAt40219 [Agrobacterium fabacearum TT111]